MVWRDAAVLGRLRHAPGVVLSTTAALLVLSLLATQSPTAVMLAAAATAVAAVVATRPLLVTPLGLAAVAQPRGSEHVPALRAGRTTDSSRHPRRPRAPGSL